LRLASKAHVHCGEGALLSPDQLWLLGLKADLNAVELNALKNMPKVPSNVLLKLLKERERLGGFCDWEEVANISGIGPARLKSLKEHLFIQCNQKR
jgi:DNA uptake protein ComE-like DNA-binding protein